MTSRTLGSGAIAGRGRRFSQALPSCGLRSSSLDQGAACSFQTSGTTHTLLRKSGKGGFVFKKSGPERNIETDQPI